MAERVIVDAISFGQAAEAVYIALRKSTDPQGLATCFPIDATRVAREVKAAMERAAGEDFEIEIADWERLIAPIVVVI